ncbi:MAG: hypothetical protein ACK559_19625, partial [bacterium]
MAWKSRQVRACSAAALRPLNACCSAQAQASGRICKRRTGGCDGRSDGLPKGFHGGQENNTPVHRALWSG